MIETVALPEFKPPQLSMSCPVPSTEQNETSSVVMDRNWLVLVSVLPVTIVIAPTPVEKDVGWLIVVTLPLRMIPLADSMMIPLLKITPLVPTWMFFVVLVETNTIVP